MYMTVSGRLTKYGTGLKKNCYGRILSAGLDRAMQARLAVARVLVKHGYTDEVPMPDIATKEKV